MTGDRPHDRDNPNCWCHPTTIRNQTVDLNNLEPDLRALIEQGEHVIFDGCTIRGGTTRG